MLLRDIPLSESSVDYIAQGWLSRSVLDLPLDEPTRAAHIYVKLTAHDVRSRLRPMAPPGRSGPGGSRAGAALGPDRECRRNSRTGGRPAKYRIIFLTLSLVNALIAV